MRVTVPHAFLAFSPRHWRGLQLTARASTLLVYPVLIFWVYASLISPSYTYLGFTFREPPVVLFVLTLIASVAVGMLLPQTIRRPSDLVVWMLYLICVCPAITVGLYATHVDIDLVFWSSLALGLAFSLCIGITRLPVLKVSLPRLPPAIFWGLMVLITLACYVYIGVFVGFRVKFLSLSDIYSVRSEFKDQLANAPLLAGYLYPLVGRVLNPLFILWGLTSRRYVPVVLGVLGELLLYLTIGSKTFLFSPIAVVVVWAFFRWSRSRRASTILYAFIGATGLFALVDWAFGIGVFSSLFTRRFLMTPGIQTSAYVDTFTHHDLAYYGDSVLRWFVHYPYSVPLPKVVAASYWHSDTLYANGNVFADGFANLGFLGFFVVAVLLGLYLQAVNVASRGLSLTLSGSLVVMIALSFGDTAFFTSLLTGGGIVAFLALALMPRNQEISAPGRSRRGKWSALGIRVRDAAR